MNLADWRAAVARHNDIRSSGRDDPGNVCRTHVVLTKRLDERAQRVAEVLGVRRATLIRAALSRVVASVEKAMREEQK